MSFPEPGSLYSPEPYHTASLFTRLLVFDSLGAAEDAGMKSSMIPLRVVGEGRSERQKGRVAEGPNFEP